MVAGARQHAWPGTNELSSELSGEPAGEPTGNASADAGLVIAVDGPSGSGKSTAARGVASALGLRYLDTGAMYRAVTWWMLEHDIDPADAAEVVRHGVGLPIEIGADPASQRVLVDGTEVTAQIRERRVSNAVSLVAAIPEIRGYLIAQQRQIIGRAAAAGGIVAEGRDIGTVVAPDAAVKVFLTASEQARAERRAAELIEDPGDADRTRREQARRDRLDAPQSQRAADAVEIDATKLALPEVIARIVGLARSKQAIA
jgi:CMP/dCMP kinase